MVNELEQSFDRGYKKYLKNDYWMYNQPDIPFYLIQKSKLKFSLPQLPDRILISILYPNLLIELKSTMGKSIPINNIKNHQIKDLREFNMKGGHGYFIFSFQGMKSVFLIPISIYIEIVNNLERKSIPIEAMNHSQIRGIPIEKLRKNLRLNLSLFKTKTIFFEKKIEF